MEIFVEIQENVRGTDVFILQSTSFPHQRPLDGIADYHRRAATVRRAPHYGGDAVFRLCPAGSQAQVRSTPISAKLVANLITRAERDRKRSLPVDLARRPDSGLLRYPDRQPVRLPVMVRDIREKFDLAKRDGCLPDVGGGARRGLAKRINAPLAIIDKRANGPARSEVMHVIGEVAG